MNRKYIKRANIMSPFNITKMNSLLLLVMFCLLPAFQTAVSVYWEWHTAITYPVLKAIMILIPVIVWLKSHRGTASIKERLGLKRTNTLPGLCVGAIMGGVILSSYYAVLRPMVDPSLLIVKIRSLGLLEHYWIMTLTISLWNSMFEEYYWRGFIMSELQGWSLSIPTLCVLGGMLFGLHHLFVVLPLFEWPVVLFCTLGVMAAGSLWSWMRLRGYSILDCYVSHVVADLSIMWIGYDLIKKAL